MVAEDPEVFSNTFSDGEHMELGLELWNQTPFLPLDKGNDVELELYSRRPLDICIQKQF